MLKSIYLLFCMVIVVCYAFTILPGGYYDLEVGEEEVVTASGHAAQQLSEKFASKYHHKLVKVVKAEAQVVAGVNYRLDIIVGMTDCKKDEVEYEEVEACNYQDSISTYKKCTVTVYRDLQGTHKLTSSGCILASKKDL